MSTFTGVGVSPGRIVGPVRQMPPAISAPSAGEILAEDGGSCGSGSSSRTRHSGKWRWQGRFRGHRFDGCGSNADQGRS